MKRNLLILLFLPIFTVIALVTDSVTFAQEFDREALKAELKRELRAELMSEIKEELKAELKSDFKQDLLQETAADIQRATEEATFGLKEELKSEIFEETHADFTSRITKWAEESPLLNAMKGVTVGGFVDVNFLYNLRNHGEGGNYANGGGTGGVGENDNGYVNFVGENEDNSFTLENFALFLDKEATDEHPIGWQMHTYWGEKAKRITFLGDDNDTIEDTKFAIATANITWNAPIAGKTVPITIGKMYTWIGYELVENINNPNYTHGVVYNNAIPFTHTGMSFDVSAFLPSDKWGLTFYYVNGWDSYIDNNEGKSYGSYLTWQPNDDFFISLATIYGPEGWGASGDDSNGDNTMMYDIVATYALPQIEKLSLGFNWDHGYSEETDLAGSSTSGLNSGAHWWAAVGYAMWDFTDNQQGALRYEYFDDQDGAKWFGHSMWTVTYTQNMKIRDNLMIRPEIRYNKYNTPESEEPLSVGPDAHAADSECIVGVGVEYVF